MKTVSALLIILSSTTLYAQDKRVYLDPHDPFTPYFSSALQKKNVPVIVTADPNGADYTVQFHAQDSNGSILQGISNAVQWGVWDSRAYNEITMRVIDDKTKDVVFSYTCRKHDQFTAADSRRATSVAECLAKHWKNKLPKQ